MTPDRRAELDRAYRDTDYRAALRVDAPALIDADSWAFLTACNPMSETLPDEENAARTEALRRDLAAYRVVDGEAASPDGTWREASFLVLEITLDDARALAVKHRQAAFLFGERGQPARLVWTV
ncbi:MAG: DUF3293 domain-containing protein [Gemmataceae bacterium]|nr:DUF3293 domain-containing protein [Gemmataceae bacterium]